jgi:autotransporter-associated beta strand protein
MKMKRKMLSLVLASVTTVLCAADRTWDGSGSDANWGTAANWGGTVPTTNDVLYFGGAAKLVNTNDLSADTPFAGVMFNSGAGAFTLAGNRITLDGNITNRSTIAQTINLDLALSGTRTLSATSGAITVNGAISGAGGLTKTGIQPLILSASNSYAGVTTVKTGGVLRVTNANALGSTNGANPN